MLDRKSSNGLAVALGCLLALVASCDADGGMDADDASMSPRDADVDSSMVGHDEDSGVVLRHDGGSDGSISTGEDNPDGYPTSGAILYMNDFEDDSLFGMWEAPVTELSWGADFGYGGSGAFRAIPQPFPSSSDGSPNEDQAGWGMSGEPTAPDALRRVFISYLVYVSQDLIDDIADPPSPPGEGRAFWQAGNKIVDVSQYDASGGSTDSEVGFRYVIKLRRNNQIEDGRVQFSHLAGGAGAEYFDDGMNTNPDWRTLGDQWVWVMHVLDEQNTEMRTYVKRASDVGVQRALVRDETHAGPDAGDFLQSHGRGFRFAETPLWGYWDDIVNAATSDSSYVAIDRVRVSDYWIPPPF